MRQRKLKAERARKAMGKAYRRRANAARIKRSVWWRPPRWKTAPEEPVKVRRKPIGFAILFGDGRVPFMTFAYTKGEARAHLKGLNNLQRLPAHTIITRF